MGIKIPNTNFDYNAGLTLDDEEGEDNYLDISILGGNVSSRGSVFGKKFDPRKDPLRGKGKTPEDQLATMVRERKPAYTSFKPTEEEEPKEEEPQGLFDDVTDIDARQERERQAFADELAARKAEEIQRTEARAGLGGMGLSGATSELVGDVARQAERAGDIAMADLGRRQSQEKFVEIQRQASIWDLEQAEKVDLDGDGFRGNPDLQEKPGDPETGQMSDDQKNLLRDWFQTYDYSFLDPDTEPGTEQEPYQMGQEYYDMLTENGFKLTRTKTINGKTAYIDQFGNYYVWITDENPPR